MLPQFLQAKNEFEKFLIENKDSRNKNRIINFIYKLNEPIAHPISAVLKKYTNAVYFENSTKDFSFVAIDEVFSIVENGYGRFDIIDKKLKEILNSVISNSNEFPDIEFPLFCGGMKFTIEHDDEIWKDFNDSNWLIPAVMIVTINGTSYLVLNTQYQTSKEAILEKMSHYLTSLSLIDGFEEVKYENYEIIGNTPKDKKKWKLLVEDCIEKINDFEIEKVVISRKVELKFKNSVNLSVILSKMQKKYSNCSLFIIKRNDSFFFGASPETIAEFNKGTITLDALAGSWERDENEIENNKNKEDLLNSEKNRFEHKIVVDFLDSVLAKCEIGAIEKSDTVVKELSNVNHLHTIISGKLENNISIFNILKEIYPSPALCGLPKDKALSIIKKLEEHNRGLYSGIIGWFNLNNTGYFTAGIRSALYQKNKVYAYAGCGIVHDSDPEEEYRETLLKLNAVINLFMKE